MRHSSPVFLTTHNFTFDWQYQFHWTKIFCGSIFPYWEIISLLLWLMFDPEYNRALRQCNNLAEHPARLCAPNPILQPDAFSLVSTELLYASLQFIHNFSQLKKKKKNPHQLAKPRALKSRLWIVLHVLQTYFNLRKMRSCINVTKWNSITFKYIKNVFKWI